MPIFGRRCPKPLPSEEEMKKRERYAEKRRQMEEVEQQNIDAILGRNEVGRGPGPSRRMMPRAY